MKRIIIIAFFVAGCIYAQAQPVAGTFFVGGELSFYTVTDKTKSDGTTYKNGSWLYLTLLPTGGYFISEKFAVGARIGVDVTVYKRPDADMDKSVENTFVMNPFARYYILSGKGGIFAEASVSAGIGTYKEYYADETQKQNEMTFSSGIIPGVYYYITEQIALEAKFGWFGFETEVTKDENDVKDITNYVGLSVVPESFTFGVTFTF
jgi:hypothetical protein